MLDPILRKRAGLNMVLIEHWPQIVGSDISEHTVPFKIIWEHHTGRDGVFRPATLIVVSEGFAALKLMHETDELIQRVNSFFGYAAIGRIKVEQKRASISVGPQKAQKLESPLDKKDKERVEKMLEDIEDTSLRQLLYELGCCIFAEKIIKYHKGVYNLKL